MSTIIRNLPYKRFVRQARTDKAPLVATQATLDTGFEMLKVAPWRQARGGIAVTMPASDPTVTTSSDAYDAYKFGGDCAAGSGRQAAFLGMAAYRFKLPDDAQNVGAHDNVTLAAIKAYSNKFLAAGLMVTAYINDFETPGEIFSTGNTEDDFNSYRSAATNLGAVLPETAEHQAGTKTAVNGSATLNVVAGATEAKKYLWVFIQLWDWTQIKWEYWIEGAGFLDAATISVEFDRDGVEADAPSTTFEFPVELEDLVEPSKVYPLGPVRDGFSAVSFSGGTFPGIKSVAASLEIDLGLRDDGTVSVLYRNPVSNYDAVATGAASITGAIAIAVGEEFAIALHADGTVTAWGTDTGGSVTGAASITGAVAVACTNVNGIALRADGTIKAWGGAAALNADALTITNAVSVAASTGGVLILCADGTLKFIGESLSYVEVGAAAITGAVAIGYHQQYGGEAAFALHADGTVTAWGDDEYGAVTEAASVTGAIAISCGRAYALALHADGTVTALGDPSSAVVLGAASITGAVALSVPFTSTPRAYAIVDTSATLMPWTEVKASAVYPFGHEGFDSDYSREAVTSAAVARIDALMGMDRSTGQYSIRRVGNRLSLSMAVCGRRHKRRATNGAPTKLHYSLPPLTGDAVGELYIRVCAFEDNNAIAVSPISTIEGFSKIWFGNTPAGYTMLGSEYVRHAAFQNSRFLSIQSPGLSGVIWLVIMPIHVPLAGDSLSWDITQTGWDADVLFLYRD